MKRIQLVFILFLGLSLSACVGMVVAGAAAGGYVISDQRSFHEMDEDYRIANDIRLALRKEKQLQNSHIVVSSFYQMVFLGGQTPKASYRYLAERVAQNIEGVHRVYNEITIQGNTNLEQRAKDSWISGSVKTLMIAKKGLRSGGIKVITENGVVYLMGEVSHDQANLAVDVARRVDGVRRVVKLFKYTD